MIRHFIASFAVLGFLAAPALAHTKNRAHATPVVLNGAVPGMAQLLYGNPDPKAGFTASLVLIASADDCGVISDDDASYLINKGATQFLAAHPDDSTIFGDVVEAAQAGEQIAAQKGSCDFFRANPAIAAGIQQTVVAAKTETFIP
jgi:hypothetical protein